MMRPFIAAILVSTASPVAAQGIPVVDTSAIAMQQANFAKEIAEMARQLEEARRLYDSVNGMTDMNDVVAALNDPGVREVLGPDFMSVASSLADPMEDLGDLQSAANANQSFTRLSREDLDADDFYRRELDRASGNAARDGAVGSRILQNADERLGGLEQLRQELGNVTTQKEVDALSARISLESSMLQNDTNRIEGLAMLQSAQERLTDARANEAELLQWEKTRTAWEEVIE